MKKKKIIIYLYNRLLDPLIQGNIFQYIYNITNDAEACPYEFTVVTYEDDAFPVPVEKRKEILEEFAKRNIHWVPIKWHQGTSAKDKLTDLLTGMRVLWQLRRKGYKYIVTLASIAGSFGYLASVLLRMRLYLYQYEPHSEYAVDNNIWSSECFNYKSLKFLEKKSAEHATVISSGTKHMQERLINWNVKARFFKIPSVTNDQYFFYSDNLRKEVRDRFGIPHDKKVVVYPGKFGDLYYGVEVFYVFKWLSEAVENLFFLIITPNNHDQIREWIKEVNIPESSYTIGRANYEEMPGILSAADFGIVNVPPGPSKKFISNIKVGEYLCCGLPYLICNGISEDDWYAETHNVGVVVGTFSEQEIKAAIPRVRTLINENKSTLLERCRRIGVEYRGLSSLQTKFESALQSLVS